MPKIGEQVQNILDLVQENYDETTSEDRKRIIVMAGKKTNLNISVPSSDGTGWSLVNSKYMEIECNPAMVVEINDPTWIALLQIKEDILKLAGFIYEKIQTGGGALFYEKTYGIYWNPGESFTSFAQQWEKSGMIRLASVAMPYKEQISINARPEVTTFVEALVKIPVEHFKKCPECDSFFIQQTMRVRKFCSTKCRNRYNIKEKYKAKK